MSVILSPTSESTVGVTPRSDLSVDTMRAIACIALVSFHTAGADPEASMRLADNHWLSILNRTFVDMRMPMFSFLSGLVFVDLGRTQKGAVEILRSKARRLLIPLVTVGLLYWLMRDLYGQDQPPAYRLLFFPYVQFWFLQATFVIMVSLTLLTAVTGHRDVMVAWLLLGTSVLLWFAQGRVPISFFSISGALYLMPFFMAGYLSRYLGRPRIDARVAVAILAIVIVIGAFLALEAMVVAPALRRVMGLTCGLAFCLVLLSLQLQSAHLARIGAMSYAIFLFHYFFITGAREVANLTWSGMPDGLVWLMGLVVGIAGPVILYSLIVRNRISAFLFLGLKIR